jgi:hypothetical protein
MVATALVGFTTSTVHADKVTTYVCDEGTKLDVVFDDNYKFKTMNISDRKSYSSYKVTHKQINDEKLEIRWVGVSKKKNDFTTVGILTLVEEDFYYKEETYTKGYLTGFTRETCKSL